MRWRGSARSGASPLRQWRMRTRPSISPRCSGSSISPYAPACTTQTRVRPRADDALATLLEAMVGPPVLAERRSRRTGRERGSTGRPHHCCVPRAPHRGRVKRSAPGTMVSHGVLVWTRHRHAVPAHMRQQPLPRPDIGPHVEPTASRCDAPPCRCQLGLGSPPPPKETSRACDEANPDTRARASTP